MVRYSVSGSRGKWIIQWFGRFHKVRASAGRFLHYGTSWRAVSTNSPEPRFGESYASIALMSSRREYGDMVSLQISLYIFYIKKKNTKI